MLPFNGTATIIAAAIFGGVYYFIALAIILAPFDGGTSASSQSAGVPAPNPAPTSAPAPQYSASIDGSIPHVQFVGLPFTAHVNVTNTGSDISELVADLGGCSDHWALDDATGENGAPTKSGVGDYYDFGSLPAGKTDHIKLTLAPKDAGNHDCDIAVHNGWDSSTQIPSGDPLDSVSASVAINP